ncbi:ArsR/SmtB family transcription factor [Pseudoalteromonas fenneropenaei]|uniref:ArsR/SmtB family transcription factor n=1 Tax=Pseudoalteromonas fenneropenaei TaxID=1737459 RepID=A0ABV7CIV9_9GAMM
MKIEEAASQLAELGHVVRLNIYKILVKAGHAGLAVSEIQDKLDIPGSTLSHHIARLVKVGLITQTREGRVLRCHAQFKQLNGLIDYLQSECCSP